jgi:integrase
VLTEEGIELLKGMVAGRDGRVPLLLKAGGGIWLKSHQTRPMAEACKNAKITPAINFHAIRHTYASLMIMNGAPLMVVARNLGHADTRMVEKHYGHLSASYVAEAVRASAPRFGMVPKSNLVPVAG